MPECIPRKRGQQAGKCDVRLGARVRPPVTAVEELLCRGLWPLRTEALQGGETARVERVTPGRRGVPYTPGPTLNMNPCIRRSLLAAICAFGLICTALAQNNANEIPLERCDRLPVVKVNAADREMRFLVDTGATTVLNLKSFAG